MNRFRWLALFVALALIAYLRAPRNGREISSPTSAVSPAGSTATPEPERAGTRRQPRQAEPAPPVAAIDGLLGAATALHTREFRDPAQPRTWRKSQLVGSSFKYPLLQVDERWTRDDNGSERRISRTVQVADHAMMRFPRSFDRGQVDAWCAGRGLVVRRKLATDDVFLIQVPRAAIDAVAGMIREFEETFGNDQALALAEPDHLVFADAVPSDPDFGSLWGLNNTGQSSGLADADIDAPEAWILSTGSRDVIVGVIDSGIDSTHPDLAANMWSNPGEIAGNGIDDDANGYIDDTRGWDFYANDADPIDENGHGTHCAGTIGAVGDNATGVAGVNWEVSLVGLRFLSAGGSGSTSDAIEAVNYARGLSITLTSNSWGGGGYSALLEQAIRGAGDAGQLFIAAAGNDATDNDLIPHYPSSFGLDNVIAVASTTRTDALSSFSCFGRNSVDLAAPGSEILSTVPGTGYGTKSGTSMATPHVAGVAALLYSISPGRGHIDIKDVLLQTADPLPGLDGRCVSGGRLNASRAAAFVAGPRVVPDTVTLVELTGNQDGTPSPGEQIALDVSFKNAGSEPAEDCSATLALAAPFPGVSVSGGPFAFNSLDPGEVAAAERFTVALDPSLTTPSVVHLAFTVTSISGQSWTGTYPLGIHTMSRISGRVSRLDGLGGIAGATVSYGGPRTGSVTADGNGDFEIQAVDGTYTLQATAAGYMPGDPVTRTVPPDATGVELRLGSAELQASPGTLTEALPAGDAVTRTIQLHNPGNAALRWSATTRYLESGAMLPAHAAANEPDPDHAGAIRLRESIPSIADDGVDLSGIAIGMLSGSFPVFAPEMASRGATVTALSLPLVPQFLEELNLVVIDDAAASLTAADIALLREWTEAGGSLLLEGDESFSMGNTNQLLAGTGIQGVTRASFGYDTVTDILPHEITENVLSVSVSSYGAHCAVSGNAVTLARYPSGNAFAAVSTLGSGRVFLAGNEITYSGDWATGDTRRFLHQSVAWLGVRNRWLKIEGERSGTLPPGGTVAVEVVVDASFMEAGLHEARLVFTSDSSLSPSREIPVQLTVSDAPAIAFSPPQLVFPDTPLSQTATLEVALVNPGTLELAIDSFGIADPAFSAVLSTPVTLAPHARLKVPVSFHPDRLGPCDGIMAVTSNDPTDPNAGLPLAGNGMNGPVLSFSPGSFSVVAPQGTTPTEMLTIENPGDMPLEWSTRLTEGPLATQDPLTGLIGRLDAGQTRLAAALPGRHFFEGGITGSDIDESSLFYSANQIYTDLAPYSDLPYSDGQVVASSSSLGPAGRYFTRKYPGIFVFSAELDGVGTFNIDGSNALNSEALLEGCELLLDHRGRRYRGFVRRTYLSGKPSIHHLVIVEDQTGIGQTYSTSPSSEEHEISGLGNTRRLHYLFFTGGKDHHYDDDRIREFMRVFLSLCDADLPWAWTGAPAATVPPGQSVAVPLHFRPGLLPPGTREGVLTLTSNQPGRPPDALPLSLTVTAAPVLAVSAETLEFPDTPAGSTCRMTLRLENQGLEPIEITPSITPGVPMQLPVSQAMVLEPGGSRELPVDFAPELPGTFSGHLALTSPGNPPRQVDLSGSAVAAGPLTAAPRTIDVALSAAGATTRSLSLENPSAAVVDWSAAILLPPGGTAAPRLHGLNVLVVANSTGNHDQLATRFKNEGANWNSTPSWSLEASQLEGKELVIIDSSLESISSTSVQALRAWISAGGALMLHHGSSSYTYSNALTAGTGITFSSRAIVSNSTAVLLPHPATRGVADVPFDYSYLRIDPTAPATTIATSNGVPFGAVAGLGSGRLVAFAGAVFADNSGETRHLDLAVSAAAWASRRPVTWLNLSPVTGQVPTGDTTVLEATVNATGLTAGDHFAEVEIATTNPAGTIRVPVRLSVSGTPDLAVTPAAINLPPAHAGFSREAAVTLENRGAAPLRIDSITASRSDLGVDAALPLQIAPYGSVTLDVVHRPVAAEAAFGATLSIASDDPDQPLLEVPVTGSSLLPPVAGVATELPLRFTLAAGSSTTTPLEITNLGAGDLTWTVPTIAVLSSPTLANILPKLDANLAAITAAIPGITSFDGGESGTSIDDGGLFLGANRLSTDLADHVTLDYSDGAVANLSQCLGTGGRYFTRKHPGLFVFAADIAGVDEFRIAGDLGTGSADVVDGSSLILPRQQTAWRGFVKRVHGPGRPPVHHLVIVEDRPGLTHAFPAGAGDDGHVIGGLNGATRLYHLMFTGEDVTGLDDAQLVGVMSAFLDAILGTPAFATVSPNAGTIAAGGNATTTLTVSAAGLNAGIYHSALPVRSNDPLRPVVLAPVELTVTGTPRITVSRTTATFTSTFAGGQGTPLTATVTNSGTEQLSVSSLAIDPPFTVTPPEPFTLAPGAQRVLTLGFAPPAAGSYQGSLLLLSDAVNLPTATIALSGSGIPAPQATSNVASFNVNLGGTQTANRSLTLSNPGGSALQWSTSADYTINQATDGKDLAGVRIAAMSIFEPFLTYLEDQLTGRGATFTYLNAAAAPDPAPYDVILLDGVTSQLTTAYTNTLRTWVQSGGCLLAADDLASTTNFNALLTGTGMTYSASGSSSFTSTLAPHPINTGITSIWGTLFRGSFTLTGQALPLVKSGTYNMAAVSPLNKGWIIASAGNFYDVFALGPGTTDNNRFANQCFSWLAGRLRSWITPNPASGTTAIGGSSNLAYAINAAGMLPGTYQATIKVTTNSPQHPLISIPVTLTIPVESALGVTKSTIAFAETKAGVPLSTSLGIVHTGSVPVTISAVGLPAPFTITGLTLPVTLKQGASLSCTVRFSPLEAGSFTGSITFTTDAITPRGPVALSGSARIGPALVAPAPLLQFTRFSGGSLQFPLQVANAGLENLTWSAAVVSPSAPGTASPDLAGLRVGVFANNHTSFTANLTTWGATVTSIPTNAGLLAPQGFDTIVIDGRMTSLVTAHFTALRDWVKAGGTLILEGSTWSCVSRLNSLVKDSGLIASHVPVETAAATTFAAHPVMQGVTALTATDCEISLSATGSAEILAGLADGDGYVGVGELGKGRILALGQQSFADSRYAIGNARQLAANALSVLRPGRDAAWLAVNANGGTLTPGTSGGFEATLDASALAPGAYRRAIRIQSNDPLRPVATVVAEFTVLPPLETSSPAIDFGAVMIGDHANRVLTISCATDEALELTPTVTGPASLVATSPAPMAVREGHPLTLPLTFTPDTEGPAAGWLALETVAGPVTIPLSGLGTPSGSFPMIEFSVWRSLHFPQGTPFTSIHDDPDGDGLDLGLEYAFLRDPHVSDGANPFTIVGRTPSGMRVRYLRRASFSDSAILLDTGDNLTTWSPYSPAQRWITDHPDSTSTVEIEVPHDNSPKLFLRGSVGAR